ncbi:MAG: hypothetical protein U9Q81_14240, partial [Pseudomonadota bacterium]|nr:hypothetical protein [Pseudomonadota bacterium]
RGAPASLFTFLSRILPGTIQKAVLADRRTNQVRRAGSGWDVTLGILALATIAVVVVGGHFPWFLLPLGIFLFFASCLPWRRFP